jgi:hypothetical protein
MLFLQSVTKYAEKVKQADEPKVNFISIIKIIFEVLLTLYKCDRTYKFSLNPFCYLSLDDWGRERCSVKR